MGEAPAAWVAASPPLLPAGERAGSYGLFVLPCTALSVTPPEPPGGTFVLPRRIAPARRIRATATASSCGTTPIRSGIPTDVSTPAVANTSFAVNGTPCRGPRAWPRARDASAARASSTAPLASQDHHRIDRRVDCLDPLEECLDDLNGRDLTLSDDLCDADSSAQPDLLHSPSLGTRPAECWTCHRISS
jgi:hypothetical protein